MTTLVGSTMTNSRLDFVAYTTITGSMPSGASAGMLLEAIVSRTGTAADSCTPPSGWTQITNNFSSSASFSCHVAVFYKISVGADDLTFTMNSLGNHGRVEVNAYSGFNTSSPISIIGTAAEGSSGSTVLPSITTVSSNTLVRSVVSQRNGTSGTANGVVPTGFTAIFKSSTNGASSGLLTGSAYKEFISAGSTGTVDWGSFATSYWRGINYAISPASGTVSAIDDPIVEGASFNYTQSGMGTLSGITTNKTGVTVSSVTASSAVLSGWTEGGLYPDLPSAVQFEFTGSTGSALKSSNISAPAGYTKLTIASPLFIANTLPAVILAVTGRTIVAGDVFQHTTYGDLVITDDGDWEATGSGSFDLWLRVAAGADAGKMYQYTVTITESGAVVVTGGLTSSGLTSSGLTRVGLTSSGL